MSDKITMIHHRYKEEMQLDDDVSTDLNHAIGLVNSKIEKLNSLENLGVLPRSEVVVAKPLTIKLEALQRKLKSLRALLMLTRKRCKDHDKLRDLFGLANVAARIATYLSHSCMVDEINEEMVDYLVSNLSALILMIDPVTPEVRKIYIGVLETDFKPESYRDLKMHIIYMEFVESLLTNIKELLCVSWAVPMKNQIENLHAELKFLREIFLCSMDLDKTLGIGHRLCRRLEHIQVMSIKAGLMVFSLYDYGINKKISEEMYSLPVTVMAKEVQQLIDSVDKDYRRLEEGTRGLQVEHKREYMWIFTVQKVDMLHEIKLLNSKKKEIYRIMSSSSKYHFNLSNSLLIEFIDSLPENLKLLVNFKVDLAVLLKIKLDELQGKLRSLGTFLMLTEERCKMHETLKDFFKRAKFVACEAAYLSFTCLVDEAEEDMVDNLSGLLQKIDQLYISGSDETTSEVLESLQRGVSESLSVGLPYPAKNKLRILYQELVFLGSFLKDPPNLLTESQTLSGVLKDIRDISSKATLMINLLDDKKMVEEKAEKVSSLLADFLEEIKLYKEKIKEIYSKIPKSPFPKLPSTNELGFFDCFFENLTELLNHRTDSITCHSLDLLTESLVEDFRLFRSFLTRIAKQHKREELKVLWTQIINVAGMVQYIFDSLLVGNGPVWYLVLWFQEVKKEIEALKAVVNATSYKMMDNEIYYGEKYSCQASLEATSSKMDDVSVGFEDEELQLIDYLLEDSEQLQAVSIVGMAGRGKTYLAKRIFNDPRVKGHFHVQAWCHVSQGYKKEQLLSSILSQVAESTPKVKEEEVTQEKKIKEEKRLDEKLFKSLKGRRYFILMDDVWDVEVWHKLKRSFPEDNCRSRIIFTSRYQNLDLKVSTSTHFLRPFKDVESWQLLERKLFREEDCPSALLAVGQQIAKRCNGLPFTVTLVAGFLAKISKTQDQWQEVFDGLSSYITGDESTKVVELSYNHMPDNLKPCLLYFAAFSHKKYIRVQKLIRLWVAEGFIQRVEQKSLENIAEDYLMDLIDRSLVRISEKRSSGGIKKCHVHDLVRDFCVKKSEDDNFLKRTKKLEPFDLQTHEIYEQHRICSNQPRAFLNSQAYISYIRSLLFLDCEPDEYPNASSLFNQFKLLEVLDLGYILLHSTTFPDGITSLRCLRYLVVCGKFVSIPSSISDLQSLETLIVKIYHLELALPDTIWKLVKLRHLCIKYGVVLIQPTCSGVSRLDNLQTVSNLILPCEDATEELLERISSVKRLSCKFIKSWNSSRKCNRIPKMATLTQLESLSMSSKSGMLQNYEFSFPTNIKRLTLSCFCFPWSKISIIGKLPNLEVLKLLYEAFKGVEWEMGDGEFPKLKFLKLRGLDIGKWSVPSECDNFPPLEQLVLESCRALQEIPDCLQEIYTLKMIVVRWCNSTLENVVEQIQEEQHECNPEFKVIIDHNIYDEEIKLQEDSHHSSTQDEEQDSEVKDDSFGDYFYDSA